MNDSNLFKDVIAESKARLRTELAWCKCPYDCMCGHCKPLKMRLAVAQAREELEEMFSESFEERFLAELESGKYEMRSRTHMLSDETLDKLIEELERD